MDSSTFLPTNSPWWACTKSYIFSPDIFSRNFFSSTVKLAVTSIRKLNMIIAFYNQQSSDVASHIATTRTKMTAKTRACKWPWKWARKALPTSLWIWPSHHRTLKIVTRSEFGDTDPSRYIETSLSLINKNAGVRWFVERTTARKNVQFFARSIFHMKTASNTWPNTKRL